MSLDKIENPAERTVYTMAFDLVDFAKKAGLVVTIETVPLEPLAMGNYKLTTEVRSARHAHTQPGKGPEAAVQMMPLMRTGTFIPIAILHEEWAQRNHSQSLARLAERGGLDATEALAIIEKRRWHRVDHDTALVAVMRYVDAYAAELLPPAPLDYESSGACAYVCFAANGNCIIWSTNQQQVADAAAKYGRPYIPLYGPKAGEVTSLAASDVLAERARQISAEGWIHEHDDEHVNDEIAAMACYYAMPPGARDWPAAETGYGATWGEAIRPENWNFQSGDRRRELVKAAALALAEIERMDRAAAKGGA